MSNESIHVPFAQSETVWHSIDVPTPAGGWLHFDLPDGWGPDAFGAVFEQAEREECAEYLRTHQPPDIAAFVNKVQARINMLAGA